MNYVAVDTASDILKVLVVKGGRREYFQCADFKAASVALMPELDACLKRCGASLADMDCFACVTGPGSFTGIRIGMATVKAFAYVFGKPVVPVTALDLLAYNNRGEETVIAVCNAGNGLRYTAVYDAALHTLMEPRCLTKEEFADFVGTVDEPFGLYADAASADGVPGAHVPTEFGDAFAAAVERGMKNAVSGRELQPLYIRKPQAERDLEAKNDKKG